MKPLNLILLFVLGFCLVATISCKKDKEPSTKELLTGKWDMQIQSATSADVNLVEFKPSGVVTIESKPADGIPELVGNWEAQGSHVIIRLPLAGNVERFVIEGNLSKEDLIIIGTFRDTDPNNLSNQGTVSMVKK